MNNYNRRQNTNSRKRKQTCILQDDSSDEWQSPSDDEPTSKHTKTSHFAEPLMLNHVFRDFTPEKQLFYNFHEFEERGDGDERCMADAQVSPRKRMREPIQLGTLVLSAGSHECPICMEPRDSNDPHRSVSLRCGHLFGKGCLMNWFTRLEQRCPQCNGRASMRDVRPVKCMSLSAIDLTEERAMDDENIDLAVKRRRLDNSSSDLALPSHNPYVVSDSSDTESESDNEAPELENKMILGLAAYSLFINFVFVVLWGVIK